MTNPDEFYNELESFAREVKTRRDEREHIPGCAMVVITLGLLALFAGMSWGMYKLGREIHDFRSCEQTTTGVVLSRHHDHKSYYDVALLYTPTGGSEQVFVQRTREIEYYPVGARVPLRYREGQAFIDYGVESKYYNILLIGVIFALWCLLAFIFGCMFYSVFIRKPCVLLRRRWRRRA